MRAKQRLQLTLAVGLLAVTCDIAHEAWIIRTNRSRLSRLQARASAAQVEIGSLMKERDASLAAAAELTRARATETSASAETPPTLRTVMDRIADLKEVLERVPDVSIPEMRFLRPDDWIKVALETKALDSTRDFRAALGAVRKAAKAHVAGDLWNAFSTYGRESGHTRPKEIMDLAPYLPATIDPTILNRYELLTPERGRYGTREVVIRERDELAVDRTFDAMVAIGPGFGDFWLKPGERPDGGRSE